MKFYYGFIDDFRGENGEIITQKDFEDFMKTEDAQQALERIHHVLNNSKYVLIDIHLYDDYWNFEAYEDVINYLVPNASLICTEFGGPNLLWENIWNDYSPYYHANHLKKCIEEIHSLDIDIAYFFKLVSSGSASQMHQESGLINTILMMKGSYYVFQGYSRGKMSLDFIYLGVYAVGLFVISLSICTLLFIIRKWIKNRKVSPKERDEFNQIIQKNEKLGLKVFFSIF